jgi:hypothetical protein
MSDMELPPWLKAKLPCVECLCEADPRLVSDWWEGPLCFDCYCDRCDLDEIARGSEYNRLYPTRKYAVACFKGSIAHLAEHLETITRLIGDGAATMTVAELIREAT